MEIASSEKDHYFRIYKKTMDNGICFLSHWELTYRCNLRCRHCYVAQEKNRKEVSFYKAKSIIDDLKALGCLYITFSGGEIFLYEGFFEIAFYARKQGFALRLMSNLTLLNEEIIARLASLYPLVIETSIYAQDANLHDTITSVSGSFHKTIRAIEILKKRNLKVIIKFLIMKDNVKEFSRVKSLAKSLGAEFLFDFCVVKRNDESSLPLKYRLNRDEIGSFFLENNIPLRNEEDYEETFLLCSAGLNNIFISADLDVYPCVGLRYKIGNLWNDSLKDLWNSSKLDFIRKISPSDLYKCYTCLLKKFCFRCHGIALAEDKDLFGPSSFDCTVAQVLKELSERNKEAMVYGR